MPSPDLQLDDLFLPRERFRTTRDWEALLARVRYKRGWELSVVDARGGPELRISFEAEDAYRPHHTVTVVAQAVLSPWLRSQTEMLGELRAALLKTEEHELGEWLTLDGRRPFDPHREA